MSAAACPSPAPEDENVERASSCSGGEAEGTEGSHYTEGEKKGTVDSAGGRSAVFSFSSWKVVVKKSADRLETNWLSENKMAADMRFALNIKRNRNKTMVY